MVDEGCSQPRDECLALNCLNLATLFSDSKFS